LSVSIENLWLSGSEEPEGTEKDLNHCSVEYIGDHETSFELNIGISWR
jgi:hypothetical protein